ncbi:ADP-ribose pyrophosphatase [Enterococcus asini ATCC 700915]|uniref:ADP-ribose pyrophosphatase n=1 Tax=Enterococcus asini ATCC 700915 TaxID=1158606 RepID=R2PP73_9ENTE|nr:NUDIX hydrolase [Enterococcus asini]EOH85083.1 ADP-ribose pyrophosphatase [Enterococcus asini ATCC 700915]EOT57551.1 ADP-ribose pyrophosphatase [Enterococcus asini ATCC 700915]OJG12628.1 ADP-ribose pyrophosphatase [Enterococcus asini]RGW15163.1 NUDIX hydrolase [Enterococcus asini]
MLSFEAFEEKTIKRETLFTGKIIEVALDEVALPMGGTAKRELVFHPGGVGIVAITPAEKMLFVRQFRKPLERVILEIPAGKIDPGEGSHPEVTGARELEEETGYRPQKMTHLASMYLSPGFANEMLHLYLAEGLEKVENPRAMDEDEVLEVYELTLDEALERMKTGEICDAKTIYAIQYWQLALAKGRECHG